MSVRRFNENISYCSDLKYWNNGGTLYSGDKIIGNYSLRVSNNNNCYLDLDYYCLNNKYYFLVVNYRQFSLNVSSLPEIYISGTGHTLNSGIVWQHDLFKFQYNSSNLDNKLILRSQSSTDALFDDIQLFELSLSEYSTGGNESSLYNKFITNGTPFPEYNSQEINTPVSYIFNNLDQGVYNIIINDSNSKNVNYDVYVDRKSGHTYSTINLNENGLEPDSYEIKLTDNFSDVVNTGHVLKIEKTYGVSGLTFNSLNQGVYKSDVIYSSIIDNYYLYVDNLSNRVVYDTVNVNENNLEPDSYQMVVSDDNNHYANDEIVHIYHVSLLQTITNNIFTGLTSAMRYKIDIEDYYNKTNFNYAYVNRLSSETYYDEIILLTGLTYNTYTIDIQDKYSYTNHEYFYIERIQILEDIIQNQYFTGLTYGTYILNLTDNFGKESYLPVHVKRLEISAPEFLKLEYRNLENGLYKLISDQNGTLTENLIYIPKYEEISEKTTHQWMIKYNWKSYKLEDGREYWIKEIRNNYE